jgi:hypothetical protein
MSTTNDNEKDSVIDAVFDTATAWAVYGLGAAKRGFEATARWFDGRAKVMGELATKLETTAPANAPTDAPTA